MTQPTDTALAAASERLRAAIAETLADVHDHTTDPATGERAIMNAVQDWVNQGYATPTTPCPWSARSLTRWYAPHGWSIPAADIPDPGPYTVGEHVTCPHCGAAVAVDRVKTTERETGRQYVAWLAQH